MILILAILPAGCGRKAKREAAAAAAAPKAVKVGAEDIVIVREDRIVSGPTLSGTLAAKEQATVRAQVGGTVLDVNADEGETVHQGQLLARIDPGALAQSAASAQTSVASARANLATAQKQQARQETLFRQGIVSRQDVEIARQATSNARSQLAQAQAQVSTAGVQLGHTTVEAPVSGVVSSRDVDEGDVVQPGSSILTIVDLSTLQLEASIPSDQLAQIRVGIPVEFTVTGINGRTFHGRISRINPAADPTTRQIGVFAEIPNDGNALVTGLFAEGRLESFVKRGLIVPSAAIDRRMTSPAVIRVRPSDHKVERVPVTLGTVDDKNDRVEITSGVAPGDILLAGASQQIDPGAVVELPASAFLTPQEQTR